MQKLLLHSLVCDICCAAVHETDSNSVCFNGHLLYQIHPDWVKNAKIWATFHLCPEVKYTFTSFRETAFLNNFL